MWIVPVQRWVHVGHLLHRVLLEMLVFFLPLHPPVAKPDLDLSLRHTESVGNFNPGIERVQGFKKTDYLLLRVKYLLKWNSFSSSRVWYRV